MFRLWPIFATLVLLPLTGCGQKGPLYLPDDREEISSVEPPATDIQPE